MILGEYPCCEGFLQLSLPDDVDLPVIAKENCPHCGKVVWHNLSRLEPKSWTNENFLKEFTIDEETKSIKEKGE